MTSTIEAVLQVVCNQRTVVRIHVLSSILELRDRHEGSEMDEVQLLVHLKFTITMTTYNVYIL